jgi:glucosamine--fructose-6-phosphate aminotransferase (isomerizing)
MGLRDEILEQPAVLERLLDAAPVAFAPISAAVGSRRLRFAVIAARGTSDNAGIYAQYLLAIRNGLIVALAAPSTVTLYGARPDMAEALVVGISQSGRSPDIVAVLEEALRQGGLTVALTNDAGSPLAAAADHVVDLRADPERATAASKTYTAELLAVALLSTALEPGPSAEAVADLAGLPALVSTALTAEPRAQELAVAHARRERAVVLGRGYSYASAREWALKLQELALVAAMAYSAADFEHGPLALAEPGLPVLAVAPSGPELEAQVALLTRLKEEHGARLLVISDAPAARGIDEGLAVPDGIPRWLAPIVEIVPAQLYAYHLTVARGLSPENPRTIRKVTETR